MASAARFYLAILLFVVATKGEDACGVASSGSSGNCAVEETPGSNLVQRSVTAAAFSQEALAEDPENQEANQEEEPEDHIHEIPGNALLESIDDSDWDKFWDDAGSEGNKAVGTVAIAFGAEQTKDYPPAQEAILESDPEEVGAHMTNMVWTDVKSHQVEICMFTIKEEGVSTQFAKCNFGVTCQKCKFFKVEVMAGISFCDGIKVQAQAEVTFQSSMGNGYMTLPSMFNSVVGTGNPNREAANDFENAVLESVALLVGWEKYAPGVMWHYDIKVERSTGAGAKLDVKLGWDLCNSGWHCLGVDVGLKAKFKAATKLFVCAHKDRKLKVEYGLGNLAATFELTYSSGGYQPPVFSESVMQSKVRTYRCMATPQHKSTTQTNNDALCPFLNNDRNKCNGHSGCYYAALQDRKMYCFATKHFKDKHGNNDGLCPFLGHKSSCISHLDCIWAYDPCLQTPCKDQARLIHDIATHATSPHNWANNLNEARRIIAIYGDQ